MSHEIDLNSPAAVAVRISYCEQGVAKLTEIVEGTRKVNESALKMLALQQETLLNVQKDTERNAQEIAKAKSDIGEFKIQRGAVIGGWKAIGFAAVAFAAVGKALEWFVDHAHELIK